MKERPILFSAEMVRAILDGRKTQTRRIMKLPDLEWKQVVQLDGVYEWILWSTKSEANIETTHKYYKAGDGIPCPYGKPGDRLWVRETFQLTEPSGSVGDEWIGDTQSELDYIPKERPESLGYWIYLHFRADDHDMCSWWRPSIFMPRWASRITLEIANIRVERVRDITHEDAIAEGMPNEYPVTPITAYLGLWDHINGKGSWDANPWVWVVEFKRVEGAL